MDPYQILGVSPSASDDEVKQAYRTLSKKYHPDANINSEHQAEYTEKFKQVQNAYKTIMDSRKKGFTQQNFGGQSQSQSTYQYNGNEQAAFNDAAAYINAGRFQDALNVLEQIRTRNSIWFYYSALAMNGIGNNVTALEYAQTAAQMEPGNIQYIFLVQQLQAGSGQYRSTQQSYGSPYSAINCCYSFMMLQLFMTCCCKC
ncbi:DnaJ domain-containing protein [Longibaculum muris]|uniref:J domain-containing protein n=1 Tax=Longibaculum muris TaxID=1796628 RepID=UPI003AB80302